MARKKARGEFCGGAVPYGFMVLRDQSRMNKRGRALGVLIENPNEQYVIARARELRAEGLSLRRISASLAARGLFTRNGKVFDARQVKTLLEAGLDVCDEHVKAWRRWMSRDRFCKSAMTSRRTLADLVADGVEVYL